VVFIFKLKNVAILQSLKGGTGLITVFMAAWLFILANIGEFMANTAMGIIATAGLA